MESPTPGKEIWRATYYTSAAKELETPKNQVIHMSQNAILSSERWLAGSLRSIDANNDDVWVFLVSGTFLKGYQNFSHNLIPLHFRLTD